MPDVAVNQTNRPAPRLCPKVAPAAPAAGRQRKAGAAVLLAVTLSLAWSGQTLAQDGAAPAGPDSPAVADAPAGADSAPGTAQPGPAVAPVVGGPAALPGLAAPGIAGEDTAAPVLSTGSDETPVVQSPSPVLAGPEGAAGSGGPAAGTPGAVEGAADTGAEDTGTEAAGTGQTPADADSAGAPDAGEEGAAGDGPAHNEALPHDLSPRGMYEAADMVVKGVMLGLAAASLITWTIFVVKLFELFGAGRRVRKAILVIQNAETLQDARDRIGRKGGPAAFMIRAGAVEYARSYPAVAEAGGDGVKERVTSLLTRIEAQAGRRMQRGTGLLASIGSVAPFVGLFGTVWGIMNSFIGIATAQTTNLAIVAPGIAEALLATAIGLVAAIPAVIFYNTFARAISGYRQRLVDAAAGIERLVSRDLDFRVEPRPAASKRG